MDAGAGDLSTGVKSWNIGLGVEVGDDASAGVVLGGDDGYPVFFEVDADASELVPNGWEFVLEEIWVEVGAVQIGAPGAEVLHFALDCAGDDVSGASSRRSS